MADLSSVLARIPGVAGYEAARQTNQQALSAQIAQAGGLQAILSRVQEQRAKEDATTRENQFRAELAQLGPNASQEALAQVSAKYAPAADVLRSQTSSLDRQATLKAAAEQREAAREQAVAMQRERLASQAELARQRSEDMSRSQAERNQARMDMIRLTASLRPERPEPAPRPLQLTTDASGNQLIVNPDGTTRPLTTQDGQGVQKPVGADKPMTEFQGKAALYGTRVAQSDKVLRALEDSISKAGLYAGQKAGAVGNLFLSSDQRRVDQAQRDFVNGVLRQESGAVISDAEFDNAKKQYFPQPGDTAPEIAQKRANRQLAIQGFKRMSGPKGATDIDAIINEALLPGVGGTSPRPQQAGQQTVPPPPAGFKVN